VTNTSWSWLLHIKDKIGILIDVSVSGHEVKLSIGWQNQISDFQGWPGFTPCNRLFLSPKFICWLITPKVLGVGAFGRKLDHEGGALVSGIFVLIKVTWESSVALSGRRQLSMNQEAGPHQTPNLPVQIYHKCSGLQQHGLITTQFNRSDVWCQSHWAKIKVWQGCVLPGESRENLFPSLVQLLEPYAFLDWWPPPPSWVPQHPQLWEINIYFLSHSVCGTLRKLPHCRNNQHIVRLSMCWVLQLSYLEFSLQPYEWSMVLFIL
jgi:hypothetical protein